MSEIIDQNIQTQDILIANFRGLQKDFDINDVARCVGDTHPVVVIDRMVKMTSKTLRKAAFTILQLNKIDVKSIAKLIQNQRHSSVWHHMSRIICIVPTGLSLNERLIILQNFFANGFWNFVVVYETVKGIEYESLKSSGSRYKRLTIVNPKYGHLIFPDKLKNLERFEYQVASVKNSNNSYISSLMINFLHTVTHQQNSTFKMLNLQNLTILEDYWRTRKLHLLINLVTVKYSPEPTLMIYEEKSYCALVPISEITSFFLVIITKPFDRFMWVLIGLSMVCSVTVWRLFLGRGAIDSHWKVAALWFMIFIGQGLDFSSKNRTVLLLLIHLISISIFILSNAYESIVTSFMIDPSQKHLKSIKDLLESNFEIAVGQAFKYNFRNSSEFSSITKSFLLQRQISDNKMVKSICKIVKYALHQNIQTQDILIGNFGGLFKNLDLNDVSRCISDRHPVVVTDLTMKMTTKSLRKASLMIVTINKIDTNSIVSLIRNQRGSTIWHHMAKIICVIPNELSLKQRQIILQNFFVSGFLNLIIVHETSKGIETESLKHFQDRYKRLITSSSKSFSLVFPDKLKNLEGFEYQVATVKNINDSYISPLMLHFLRIIKDHQNSNYKILNLKNLTELENYWRSRKMHLLINVVVIKPSTEPTNAYESFITSFMIDPGESLLKSFKDLLESKIEIVSGPAFKYFFRDSSEFSALVNSPDTPKGINFESNLIEQRYAFTKLCDLAEHVLNSKRSNNRYFSEYYYILQERIPNQFLRLEASFYNPFLERFQHYMDLSFEAGLPKMWKVFDSYDVSKLKNFHESKDYLELKDLGPVFLILFIGCILSAFVMIIEILYQRFWNWTSNCYKSVITSFMIDPDKNYLKSLDDLIASNLTIFADPILRFYFNDSSKFVARIKLSKRLKNEKSDALIRQCYVVEKYLSAKNAAGTYYILPEKVPTYFFKLDASAYMD
ncbi:unnamed protein product [Chironomus riparius]|uniref:Ionotropic receptor n=1 Tax=Chironomus riparius TaxID=315576 RepID=A0A9N9RKP6_9DIPT|nr:unnamed protein product [Chironomus riparius]